MKQKLKKFFQFIANPRLLLCYVMAWMITNGWSYILFAMGTFFDIGWMTAVGGAYLAFLWLPISPEKVVTVAIAIWMLQRLFPDDQKTLAVLKRFRLKAKATIEKKVEDHKEKKHAGEDASP